MHVTNTLRLLELPDEVKSLIGDGRLQAGHARALLQIKDTDEADRRRATRGGSRTDRASDRGARARRRAGESERSNANRRSVAIPDLEESLADHLGTEVRIEAGRGKGRVVISFGDRDDLHRIVELLLGY